MSIERRLSDFYDAFPIIEKLGMWPPGVISTYSIIGEDGQDAYFKRSDAEAARTMAALRAVKPEDVSDEMVKILLKELGLSAGPAPRDDGIDRFYGKFVCADPIKVGRRAIAAAIAAGA